ncbi:MAG: WYL domain-containing protein [Nanoarchaeota archaeon]|nr:WYL domain-containing protein [Nanoarchaeota archaeon]
MVSFTKSEKEKLKEVLSKSKDEEAKQILNKIKNEKKLKYAEDKKEIRALLKQAFKEKKNVKIRYYSLSSDEVRWRVVSIYQLGDDFIIAYCHLRNEERTFVTDRIYRAAILDEKYKIPGGWEPESIVW